MKNSLLFIAFLFCWISVQQAYAQHNKIHAIGMLRQDGIIAPYAQYEKNQWGPLTDREISTIAYNQPDWYLKNMQDSTLVLHTGTEVIFDPNSMNRGHGILSSYSNSFFGLSNVFPKRKVGIVFSWPQNHHLFKEMIEGEKHQEILSLSEKLLIEEESKGINKGGSGWQVYDKLFGNGIPVDNTTRKTTPVSVRIFTIDKKIQGVRIIFVSAWKNYINDNTCAIPMLNGWFIENGDDRQFIKEDFGVGDCDGKMLPSFITPYVAFAHEEKILIAGGIEYYEGEDYFLFEVKENEVVSVLEYLRF